MSRRLLFASLVLLTATGLSFGQAPAAVRQEKVPAPLPQSADGPAKSILVPVPAPTATVVEESSEYSSAPDCYGEVVAQPYYPPAIAGHRTCLGKLFHKDASDAETSYEWEKNAFSMQPSRRGFCWRCWMK